MSKKQNAEEDYITTPISVLSYITALERQLEEAREENHKLEKIVQDFDGSVRYLMTVAPQLDNILKNNLLRLKEQG